MGKDVISKINGVDDSHVEILGQLSNPLKSKSNISNNAISNYSQTVSRPKYDEDIIKVVEVVRILNNLAPLTMPEYCFDANQINGDCYYKPDGTPLLIREFDSDIIRDYYYNPNSKNNFGETPLFLSLYLDNIDTFKILLKYNADCNIQRNDGNTVLHLAIVDNKLNFVNILLENINLEEDININNDRKNSEGSNSLENENILNIIKNYCNNL